MKEKNWRIGATIALLLIFTIIIIIEAFTFRYYNEKIQEDVDNVATTLMMHIDSIIDDVKNFVDIIDFPSELNVESKAEVEKYLQIWTESISVSNKISFVSANGNIYEYSTTGLKNVIDLGINSTVYKNAVYSFGTSVSVDSKDEVLIFSKPLYKNNNLIGVIHAQIPFDILYEDFKDISLYSNKYYLRIWNSYDEELFNNYVGQKGTNEFNETVDLNEDKFNINSFIGILNNLKLSREFDVTDDNDLIFSQVESKYKVIKLRIESSLNEASNYINYRLIIFSILFVILLFITIYFGLGEKANKNKFKIYLIVGISIIIVLSLYIGLEVVNITKIYSRYYTIESKIITSTLNKYELMNEDVGTLFTTLLEKTNEYDGSNPNTENKIINDYFYKLKLNINNFDTIAFFRGDNMTVCYPEYDYQLQDMYVNYKNSFQGKLTKTFDDKYVYKFYRASDSDVSFIIKCARESYYDIDHDGLIVENFKAELEEDKDYDTLFSEMKQEGTYCVIDNELSYIIFMTNEEIYSIIYHFDDDGKILEAYKINGKNYVYKIVIDGFLGMVLMFVVIVFIYSNSVMKIKKTKKYEDSLREENRSLDRLLEKVNNDVNVISKLFEFDDDDVE
ncbi:MAG: cache domain-containing protein [Clostridia bacterium]|nr:cache domain-containing protein [Clostridia bacterium]